MRKIKKMNAEGAQNASFQSPVWLASLNRPNRATINSNCFRKSNQTWQTINEILYYAVYNELHVIGKQDSNSN